MRELGLCTLPSSEPRTSARSETWSGSALLKVPARAILLKCYVFQHFYRRTGSGTRFFTKSLKRRAPTAVARLVCVEMIASETPERRRSTFLKNVCFCALVRLDYTHLRVALVFHWHAFQRYRSLWCFAGYYFVDDKRSHAAWRSSCAPVNTFFR